MKDCAINHFCSEHADISRIFEQHGFNLSTIDIITVETKPVIAQYLHTDCVKLCLTYLNIDVEFKIESNIDLDTKIIEETVCNSYKAKHWIFDMAKDIGVANTLISCGKRSTFRCGETEFVEMFYQCGKYYGINMISKILLYTGTLPKYYLSLYQEIMNQFSEYFNISQTRCLKGPTFCHCFMHNKEMFKDEKYRHSFYNDSLREEMQQYFCEKYDVFAIATIPDSEYTKSFLENVPALIQSMKQAKLKKRKIA